MRQSQESFTITVEQEAAHIRIDTFLAQRLTRYSRTFCQNLIDGACVQLNDQVVAKQSHPVSPGDVIFVTIPEPPQKPLKEMLPKIEVPVAFEHPDFLVVCKPAGLVVHAPTTRSTLVTLVDWLVAHFHEINGVGQVDRPGLVHRLDKDTSGLMLIARNNYAHVQLSNLFRERTIKKVYHALVHGHPDRQGTIDLPVARDPYNKIKMTHTQRDGRDATTHYRVLEYYENAALVEARPVTGRTHQIRVHFAALGHPLIGDPLYGTPCKQLKRQALHAHRLTFTYDGTEFDIEQDYPADFQKRLDGLRTTLINTDQER